MILSQQTKFPDTETTTLLVEAAKPGAFAINIRYPHWVAAGKLQLKVNGKTVTVDAQPGSYAAIKRSWKKGDKIEVSLPMAITTEELPDTEHYVAFLHGPIVLAAKTDTTDKIDYKGDSEQFGGYRAKAPTYPLESAPVVTGKEADMPGLLIPVAGKPQTYTAPALISPVEYKNLELIPFYKLHDSRYVIYWKEQ